MQDRDLGCGHKVLQAPLFTLLPLRKSLQQRGIPKVLHFSSEELPFEIIHSFSNLLCDNVLSDTFDA